MAGSVAHDRLRHLGDDAQKIISRCSKRHEHIGVPEIGSRHTVLRTVLLTNDPVRLSFCAALLRDAGVETVLLDGHMAAIDGSIGAIPRRLAVLAEDEAQARRVLREAGEG